MQYENMGAWRIWRYKEYVAGELCVQYQGFLFDNDLICQPDEYSHVPTIVITPMHTPGMPLHIHIAMRVDEC